MQNQEIWKPVPGFEGLYEVSSFGRVKSLSRKTLCGGRYYISLKERIMHPGYNKANGYYSVFLGDTQHDRLRRSYYVHRIVASAFLPNPHGYKEVNHKDENKGNNRVDNLEWCSVIYNRNYGTGDERRRETARKNKRGRCYPKRISQYSLSGEYLFSYNSSEEAARAVGHPNSGRCIRACALHEQGIKQSMGYIWRYTDEPSLFL